MYACSTAIKNSKPVRMIKSKKGATPYIPIIIIKDAITLSTIWPAVILAANLKDKLIGLAKYANNSIKNMSGSRNAGVPLGKNNEIKCKPCL